MPKTETRFRFAGVANSASQRRMIPAVSYDLIGDIHGYAETLIELLEKLGYAQTGGTYRHPERKVIFVGDFVDRGPGQRDVISIVRPMIEEGAALSIMGNHEYNAIAYATPDPDAPGEYLRPHSDKNNFQHKDFLAEYDGADDYPGLIEWFRTLPMWLDLPEGLRVVHACWDDRHMADLVAAYPNINKRLDDDLLIAASRRDRWEWDAVETLLKGKEIPLPNGQRFHDKNGHPRHEIRIKWWDANLKTYRGAFLGPDKAISEIPEDPINVDHLIEYASDMPPVFVGHYWMDAEVPELLAPNIACLDYSVAGDTGGKLVAYRWDGEQELSNDKFVWVQRFPGASH